MSRLEEILRKYSKPAYSALLVEGEPKSIIASKFGGNPYFESEKAWPICAKCKRPEYFICQLDLRQCPSAQLPNSFGLVSFFYCWLCYPWDPEHPGWSFINYPNPSEQKAVRVEMPRLAPQGFWAKLLNKDPERTNPCAVEFAPIESFPQWDELEETGDAEAKEALSGDADTDEYYDFIDKMSGGRASYDTMIGGYAEWIQSFPNMKCPHCQTYLRQLMQIGSEGRARIMFGDAGTAYFLFCDHHPNEVKMEVQCF